MSEKVLKYLYDIKLAIDEIDSFFLLREKRFDDYIIKDIRTKNQEQRQDLVYQHFIKFKVSVINDVYYRNDILLKRAIERNLEIIGEAVTRILREEPEFPLDNAKRIIGLRNQIKHGYDSVSDENIWGVVINHIPNLKQDILKLIE